MTDKAKDIQALQDTWKNVKDQVREMISLDEKHLRWALGIKLILLVFVIIYMGWAYANFRILDAELLVVSGQQKFFEALPELKSEMVDRLGRMAPTVIDQAGDEMLNSVPKLQRQLEITAKRTLLSYANPLEKDLIKWLNQYIQETKTSIDEMPPGLSSYEKLSRFRDYILEDLKVGLEVMGYQIGDSVREHSIVPHLKHFIMGKDLTEKEKLQRDLLAIWYLIIQNQLRNIDLSEMVNYQTDF